MRPPIIRKLLSALDPPPNLPDYDAACRDFSWSAAARELDVSMDGPFNIAALAVDISARPYAIAWRCASSRVMDIAAT